MLYFNSVLRVLWGLHYLVFGLNKFLFFAPVKASNAFAQQVIDSFYSTGYLMQTVGAFQLITGFLILINRYMNLAVLTACPVTLHIFLYTIFTANYNAGSIATGLLVIFANGYFLISQKDAYHFLFHPSSHKKND